MMITIFGYQIGMLSFFVFSLLAGVFIFLNAIFGCKDETTKVRIARGVIGAVYAGITVLAFRQIEIVDSPYLQQLIPLAMLLRKD